MFNKNSGIKGRKAYNNGIKIVYLEIDEQIPKGFVRGGLSVRTPEQIKKIAEKSRNTQKQSWKNKTEVEKKKWSEYCINLHKSRSPEEVRERVNKYLNTYYSLSDEELSKINLKRSLSNKKFWEEQSQEFKDAHMKKVLENGGGWNKETI